MNRYIFKGKNIKNGEWVCGSLLKDSIYDCVIVSDWETVHEGVYDFWVKDNCAFEIIPETLCQCTGQEQIFEYDLVDYNGFWDNDTLVNSGRGIILFKEYEFALYSLDEKDYICGLFDLINNREFKIIGNKFDNEGDK